MTLERRIDRVMHGLAAASALAGGAVLVALVLLTVASVTGRAFVFAGLGPVPGDFELIEAGIGFAVFASLPWCQITRGHATVEIVTDRLPSRARQVLDTMADWLFLLAAAVIAWRLFAGLVDPATLRRTTLILQFPLWWAYASAFAGALLFVMVSAWCAFRATLGLVRADPAKSTP